MTSASVLAVSVEGKRAVALVLWQIIALGAAYAGWRATRAELGSRALAIVVAVAVFSGLTLLPDKAVRHLYYAEQDMRLSRYRAERAPMYYWQLDRRFFDGLRSWIRPDETYYVDAADENLAFRYWAFTWLLPRVATDAPARADWVIGVGRDPRRLGVRVVELREVGGNYAARVDR